MDERLLARLDALSRALLWIWVLLVLASLVGGRLEALRRILDYSAWGVFGGSFLLSFLTRWLNEIEDPAPIGPLRVWLGASLVALLMCLASTFILAPKILTIRGRLAVAEVEGRDLSADQASLRKARNVANQMLGLRVLLALGLGYGALMLPRRKASAE
ncbi:MAG: hypothetical protein H6Q00_2647 [Holophagaceae bacterium]|nr:hypothetical protein [Holophagaceae bacterium]